MNREEGFLVVGIVAALGVAAWALTNKKTGIAAPTAPVSTTSDTSSLFFGSSSYTVKVGSTLVLAVSGTLQTVSSSNSAIADAVATGGQIATAPSVTITGVAAGTSTVVVDYLDAGGNAQTSTLTITVTP